MLTRLYIGQTAMVASLTKTRALEKVGKGKAAEEAEKGIPLAPSQKDLRPWYSEKEIKNSVDDVGEKERFVVVFKYLALERVSDSSDMIRM